MLNLVTAFIIRSENKVNTDPTLHFFSNITFITALVYCLLGSAQELVLKRFEEAIRLSGFEQDLELLKSAASDKVTAVNALVGLLDF
jgi:hypothetical protein